MIRIYFLYENGKSFCDPAAAELLDYMLGRRSQERERKRKRKRKREQEREREQERKQMQYPS